MPIKQTPTKISTTPVRIPKPQPKKLRIVRNGKDGKTPTKEELLEMIRPLIPEIPKNVPKKALIRFMEEYIAKKPLTPLTVDFNMVETDAGTEVTINGVMHLIPRAVYGPKLRNFLQMGDTPDSFQGQAGKSAVVSADEQRIEFQTISVPPESDTLQTVTTRGATTTLAITTGGLIAPYISDTLSRLAIAIDYRTLNSTLGAIVIDWETGYFNASDGSPSIDATNRNLVTSGLSTSLNWDSKQLFASGVDVVNWSSQSLNDPNGVSAFNWNSRQINNSLNRKIYDGELNYIYAFSGVNHVVVDFSTQRLFDIADQTSIIWTDREFYASDGSNVVANYANSTGMRFKPRIFVGSNLTTVPVSAIHVDNGTATASELRFTAGTTTGQTATDGFQVGITNTGIAEIRQREALGLNFYTSNTLALTIASTGISSFLASVDFRAGTATANTYPCKFTSGALLSVAVAGVQEFLTDKVYTTITTGLARKEYTLNDVALVSGNLPIITTNGRLTNSAATGYVKVTAGVVSSTTVIPSSEGGTGLSIGAPGDILQHNGTIWTRLSAVLSGSYLRSTGTNAALVWSTLKLPNAITTGRIPYATTTDNIGESTNLTFNGSNFGLFASSGTLSVYHQGTGTQTVPTADFSTSITLTNTSSLVQNYTGAGGHTLTLTTCSTGFLAGAGIQFIIKNVGTGVLTVNRASTDTMFVFSAVTTMTINIGECYTFQCRSAGQWSVY